MSTSAFTVYLINNNKYIWEYLMKGLFVNLCDQNIIKILFYVLGFSGTFVIISILIDKIRLFLFKIFKIDKLLDKLDYIYNKMSDKVISVD